MRARGLGKGLGEVRVRVRLSLWRGLGLASGKRQAAPPSWLLGGWVGLAVLPFCFIVDKTSGTELHRTQIGCETYDM